VLNKTGSIPSSIPTIASSKVLQHRGRLLPAVADGAKVKKGELAQWDPYNVPIISEKAGTLQFKDMIPVSP
jgi:DNA-directed RNA polymerase subunit beta'